MLTGLNGGVLAEERDEDALLRGKRFVVDIDDTGGATNAAYIAVIDTPAKNVRMKEPVISCSTTFDMELQADGLAIGGSAQTLVNKNLASSDTPSTAVKAGDGDEVTLAVGGVSATAADGGTLNGTYYYKVAAYDGSKWTDVSAEVSATVDGGATNGTINVAWSAAPGATSYRVWRGTAANGENEYYDTTGTSIADDGTLTFTAGTVPDSPVVKRKDDGTSGRWGEMVLAANTRYVLKITPASTGATVLLTLEFIEDQG